MLNLGFKARRLSVGLKIAFLKKHIILVVFLDGNRVIRSLLFECINKISTPLRGR